MPNQVLETLSAVSASSSTSRLEASDLAKAYKGREVVKSVSLHIESGDIVGLLGPNGAGKTTCFYMIVGLINNDRGQILLNDTAIDHFSPRMIGMSKERVSSRTIHNGDVVMLRQKINFLGIEIVAVDRKCSVELGKFLQIIEGPRFERNGIRIPHSELFEHFDKLAGAIGKSEWKEIEIPRFSRAPRRVM